MLAKLYLETSTDCSARTRPLGTWDEPRRVPTQIYIKYNIYNIPISYSSSSKSAGCCLTLCIPVYPESNAVRYWWSSRFSGLVNTSAIISLVGQYTIMSIFPWRYWCRVKWYLGRMCLLRLWLIFPCTIAIADWLSSNITVGPFCGNPMSRT
jgi:hypothetical protein